MVHRFVQAIGGWWFYAFLLIFPMANTFCLLMVKSLILAWGKEFTSEEHILDNKLMWEDMGYVGIFAVSAFFKTLFLSIGVVKASRKIHAKMIFKLLHAQTTEFLQRMPIGRIINRFS